MIVIQNDYIATSKIPLCSIFVRFQASPIVREVGNVADVGNVPVPATLVPLIVPCDSYDVHPDVPDAPGASKPLKPFSPVAPPGSPSRRSSISRPGPWSTCESEANIT